MNDTRIAEVEGRGFYLLFGFLLCCAVHDMKKKLAHDDYKQRLRDQEWIEFVPANSIEARTEVLEHLFSNLDSILQDLFDDDGSKQLSEEYSSLFAHQGQFMFPLGPSSSKPSASQLATIFSWKTNIIQGTFWIVGYIEEGAVFLHSSDDKEATVEPTCFIVKGLGSKFSEMTMGLKSDYQIPYSLACTYLLPVNGKIVTCGQVAT